MIETLSKRKIQQDKIIETNNKRKLEQDKVYGLLLAQLDSVYGERNFVLAYGDLKKVKYYKEECHLKGDILEYKTQAWLVKKLEKIKGDLRDEVKVLFIE